MSHPFSPLTYRLKLPTTWRIHNIFHAVLLKKYRETETYGENYPEPPPELEEGEEVYDVETILRRRKRGRGYQYFVKWRGYPITDASWEPEQSFSKDGSMLTAYKRRNHLRLDTSPQQHALYRKYPLPPDRTCCLPRDFI